VILEKIKLKLYLWLCNSRFSVQNNAVMFGSKFVGFGNCTSLQKLKYPLHSTHNCLLLNPVSEYPRQWLRNMQTNTSFRDCEHVSVTFNPLWASHSQQFPSHTDISGNNSWSIFYVINFMVASLETGNINVIQQSINLFECDLYTS